MVLDSRPATIRLRAHRKSLSDEGGEFEAEGFTRIVELCGRGQDIVQGDIFLHEKSIHYGILDEAMGMRKPGFI